MKMRTLMAAAATAALIIGPLSPITPFVGAGSAYAKGGGDKGGGGGGGGGGKSESKGGGGKSSSKGGGASKGATKRSVSKAETAPPPRSEQGRLASELKGLMAAHANPRALERANPGSQVGRIALYRDAALATIEAKAAVEALEQEAAKAADDLAALEAAYTGRSSADILADIALLDEESDSYEAEKAALDAELAAAESFEAEQLRLQTVIDEAPAKIEEAELVVEEKEGLEGDALMTASGGRTLSDEALAYFRELLGL
ncbi:hypothetical protein [Ostreiculturibacter nitratireducens]|uniref:hypothetical protein n=1 Tax=Ostreiculturibacter nitratireducens TaxID=3075226 RepID=UPI0031B5F42C